MQQSSIELLTSFEGKYSGDSDFSGVRIFSNATRETGVAKTDGNKVKVTMDEDKAINDNSTVVDIEIFNKCYTVTGC